MFGCDDFVTRIGLGSSCFLCGAARSEKTFNDEHVIPRWLLKRYDLFESQITLPNNRSQRYSTYKVPCCQECNSLLGLRLEQPISQLLDGTFDEVQSRLNLQNQRALFVWLCLLFVKTHLKDKYLRQNLNHSEGDEMIADDYFWPELHHVHAVARAPYVGVSIRDEVIGSMVIFRVEDVSVTKDFDLADLTNEMTIMVRLGDIGIIAVLNDSGAAKIGVADRLSRISGPLNTAQLREVTAMLGVANNDLLNRPRYGTRVVHRDDSPQVALWAKRSDDGPKFENPRREAFGSALAHLMKGRIDNIIIEGKDTPDEKIAAIESGQISFLYNEDGSFRPDALIVAARG